MTEKRPNEGGGRPEEVRGELRQQAAQQLERLKVQELEVEEPGPAKESPEQKPSAAPETKAEPNYGGLPPESRGGAGLANGGQDGTGLGSGAEGGTGLASGMPAARGLGLSLDLDVTPVGMAYHFRKLHGEPRLLLRARHEDLGRRLSAVIWAALCLALCVAAVQTLRRPKALSRARQHWPWLALIAGAAWLFLLPAGVCGLLLVAIALCALAVRLAKAPPPGPKTASAERAVSRPERALS